jgi:hypothetical protein
MQEVFQALVGRVFPRSTFLVVLLLCMSSSPFESLIQVVASNLRLVDYLFGRDFLLLFNWL